MTSRLGLWTTSTLRVRYAETDAMGIAHHAEYLAWYEVGRTDWIRASGGTYRGLEERGLFLPVIEVASRHVAPARYDEVLEIRTRLSAATRARLAFDYEVRRDGALLAEGRTEHAVADREGRARRLPPGTLEWLLGEAPAPHQ